MHKNNFDFLRLLFALLVVVTHSFELCGRFDMDWLLRLTGGQVKLSYLGVRGFFIISGFLIYGSVLRSKSIGDFYRKRILRLFPALFVVLILTVLLLPLVYEGSLPYLKNRDVWTYIPNNLLLLKQQPAIAGVFAGKEINGSLWTIKYEFIMYVFLSLAFFYRRYARWFVLGSFAWLVFCCVLNKSWILNLQGNYFNLALYFLTGSVCAVFKQQMYKHKNILLGIGIVLCLLSFVFAVFPLLQFFVLPLVVIPAGISSTRGINSIGAVVGDLSYGIYIISYPVQRTLVHSYSLQPYRVMLITIFASLGYAYLSWHLVEKKALAYKSITTRSFGTENQLRRLFVKFAWKKAP